MNRTLVISLLVLAILAGIAFYVLKSPTAPTVEDGDGTTVVASFDDCAKAGYPVMESNPRQCRTPDGKLFVEGVAGSTPANVATGGCFIGGCSGQICSDQEGAVSTCEYKEEYACYNSARCERQVNGQCGWTETQGFSICMNAILNPGADMK